MSCELTPARSAMERTRAPANPFSENSTRAASRMRWRERSASRSRSAGSGARRERFGAAGGGAPVPCDAVFGATAAMLIALGEVVSQLTDLVIQLLDINHSNE